MPLPDYEQAMLPALRVLADESPCTRRDIVQRVADAFELTDLERQQLLPSGKAPIITSRVGWALTYLKQAGLVSSPKRGVYALTERGRHAIAARPDAIDAEYLEQYPEFQEFRARTSTPAESRETETVAVAAHAPRQSPEEALEGAYGDLRRALEAEVLQSVKSGSPTFFENLVVDLLVRMGYGGSRPEAARAVGRSGDGGIDGVIDEDRLGLDVIYVQAKRWEATVGRPDVQKFAGALQGQRARKGIFITTSGFSREAEEYAQRIDSRIVLIDGARLAKLLFDYDVGVTSKNTFTVKQLDGDYFEEA